MNIGKLINEILKRVPLRNEAQPDHYNRFKLENLWEEVACVAGQHWIANPVNDMYADAITTAILQADLLDAPIKNTSTNAKIDRMHFKECLIEMLQDMFGEDSVPKIFKGEKLYVTVNETKADIDLSNLEVSCTTDETFQQIVQTAVSKLYQSLAPPQVDVPNQV